MSFYRKGLPALYMAGFTARGRTDGISVFSPRRPTAPCAASTTACPLVIGREQVRDWILDGDRTEAFLAGRPPELDQDRDYEQLSLF